MKDVIYSKDFDIRRSRSNTEKASKRASFIILQGLKLVKAEP
jgi:hypothetical protein